MSSRFRQASFFPKPAKQHAPFDMSLVATGVHIFCDGACEPNPGAGGWGYAVYSDGDEIAYGSGGLAATTNNAMELTGMLKAIEWIQDAAMQDKSVTIWCDSQYVVNGCNDWRHKWKRNGWSRKGPNSSKSESGEVKNVDLWKAIDAALNSCTALTIAWVKGHNGTLGNERADELSFQGRKAALDTAGLGDPVGDVLDEEYRAVLAE